MLQEQKTNLINVVNAQPAAMDDVTSTNEDTPLNITASWLLGNDSDPDEDTDLFSKILRDNRALKHGLTKKNIKKVS